MAFPKLKISDDDGNVADVTSNRLDVNAFLSTTDNTVLGNIKSALDTIKVDTEAIETAVEGTLTTSTAITSIVPGTGPANLGKQEDAAHSTGDLGVQMLAVRKAVPVDLSGLDGDYEPLQLDEGRLWASTLVTQTTNPDGMTHLASYAGFVAAESPTALNDASNGINANVTDAKEVIIQTASANTGFIYVGGSEAAATGTVQGTRLDAGDTLILPIADISDIFIDASAGSQRVTVVIVK